MPYSYLTFSQLCQALAVRLGDSSSTYWRNAAYGDEISVYLFEAFRTWQAYTAFARSRCTFNLAASTTWYDLTDATSTGAGLTNPAALVGPTVTDSQLVQAIQYHLIENANTQVTGTSWVGTEMFTLQDVTDALQRSLNQFIQDTGCKITDLVIIGPTPTSDLVTLADTVIDVRRAAWIDKITSAVTPLWRSSAFSATAFKPFYNTSPASPRAFEILSQSPLAFRLIPPPIASGSLDLLVTSTGPTLDPTTGIKLGILDNLSPGIKWGAMADLLNQDGPAQDIERASYCQQRYAEFVEISRISPLIVQAQIQGVVCQTGAVEDADSFAPSWQNLPVATRAPRQVVSAGLNLVAPCPLPDDTGPYSVTLDVVTNANIPANAGAFVQVGREQINAILDEAQHLAAFKQGGQEFLQMVPLHQNFVRESAIYNDRLLGSSTYLMAVQGLSQRQAAKAPRRETDVEVTP